MIRFFAFVALVILNIPSQLFSQSNIPGPELRSPVTGQFQLVNLTGSVNHKLTGHPLQGVRVSILFRKVELMPDGSPLIKHISESVDRGHRVTTDQQGNFSIAIPSYGQHTYLYLLFEKDGFESSMLTPVKAVNNASVEQSMIPLHLNSFQSYLLDSIRHEEFIRKEEQKLIDPPRLSEVADPDSSSLRTTGGGCTYSVPNTIYVKNLSQGYNSYSCPNSSGFTGYMMIDEFVGGVVAAEMGSSFPTEALKAQAVAVRTYALWRENPNSGIGGNCGMAYSFSSCPACTTAANNTSGEVLMYNGNIIQALFSARCNGQYTQNSNELTLTALSNCNLSGNSLPYLVCRPCSGHPDCSNFSESPCCNVFNSCYGFGNIYGHGGGLCQRGAQGFANNGDDHCTILNKFYTNVCITNSCSSGGGTGGTINLTHQSGNLNVNGNVANITNTLTNSGANASGAFLVYYYASTNSTISTSDYFIGSELVTGIPGGGTSTHSKSIDLCQISPGIPNNTYYIGFLIDPFNAVIESNETDNNFYFPNPTLSLSCSSGGSYDLTINSATLTPNSVPIGGTVDLECFQTLTGANSTLVRPYVGYFLSSDCTFDGIPTDIFLDDDRSYLDQSNPSEQETESVTIPGNASTGNQYLLFVADYREDITETNESNNVACVPINITNPSNDFTISSPSVSSTTLAAGSIFTVECNQNYSGTSPVTLRPDVGFFLSTDCVFDGFGVDRYLDHEGSSLSATDLSDTEDDVSVIPASLPPGNYYILFVADFRNEIPETNENNNVACVAITVTAGVGQQGDYYPTNPTAYMCSDTIISRTDIVYSGNSPNYLPHKVAYFLSDDCTFDGYGIDEYLDFSNSSGNANNPIDLEIEELTLPQGTPPGTYNILIVADWEDRVYETNENNNVACLTITIPGNSISEDFYIEDPYLDSTIALRGTNFEFGCIQAYIGCAPDDQDVRLGYYLSDDCVWDNNDSLLRTDLSTLDRTSPIDGESSSWNIPATYPPGDYYLLFVADHDLVYTESVESNNVACLPFSIRADDDLWITNPILFPDTAAQGDSILVQCNQNYFGAVSNSIFPDVGFYLSSDCQLDNNDLLLGSSESELNASLNSETEAIYVTIPGNAPNGDQYILFVADHNGEFSEGDESNNVVCLPLHVGTTSSTVNIQLSSNPANGGNTFGGGTYNTGIMANLVAVPAQGFGFLNWTENNVVVSTSTNYSFLVTGNRNLVANFYPTTSITPQSLTGLISLFPNPASDRLTIRFSDLPFAGTIQIYDLRGKALFQSTKARTDDEIELDIEKLPIGRYFTRISLGKHGVITIPLNVIR